MKFRRFGIGLLILAAISILSSCSLFRKKNRCNTCPTWHDQIEVSQLAPAEKDVFYLSGTQTSE